MVSGGFRPTAPQNNTGVSATGGNGSKDGQPLRVAPGGKYGERKASLDQQRSAPMVSTPSQSMPSVQQNLPPIVPITAPSQRPNESVMDGAPIGAGSNTLNIPGVGDSNEDIQRLLSYLPALEVAAQSPTSSQAFRNYVRVLRATT